MTIKMDEIYECFSMQSGVPMQFQLRFICGGFNIEAYRLHVCVFQRFLQTLKKIWRKMGIYDVFRKVYPGFNRIV